MPRDGQDPHEALGFQLEQGFTHRDPAGPELRREAVLAELRAGRIVTVEDAPPDLSPDRTRNGRFFIISLPVGPRCSAEPLTAELRAEIV